MRGNKGARCALIMLMLYMDMLIANARLAGVLIRQEIATSTTHQLFNFLPVHAIYYTTPQNKQPSLLCRTPPAAQT